MFLSNVVLGNNSPTLTVYFGGQIISETSEFKSPEHCKYFANRLNRHDPILNKEGKMEKMKAYCSYKNSTIPNPLIDEMEM